MSENTEIKANDHTFQACPECFAKGVPNVLYWNGQILACRDCGEVTDQALLGEYRRLGVKFIYGNCPPSRREDRQENQGLLEKAQDRIMRNGKFMIELVDNLYQPNTIPMD